MTRALRIGLVGCGQLAERGYLPAIARAKGVRLAAVADPVRSRAEKLAPSIPAFASAAELINAGVADALVLATPAAVHLADARRAADARLPTLVEKPPAANAAEAAALAGLEPPPWIGFNRRFEPELQRLRSAIPGGPVELELEQHRSSMGWSSYVVRDDALLTLSPHLIDLARWLTQSELVRVRATEFGLEHAEVALELERGRALVSCSTNRAPRNRIVVRADTRVVARYAGDGFARRALRRLTRPGFGNALTATLALQLETFADAVRGGPAKPLGTAADGLAVMAAIEAARCSAAASGRWVSVLEAANLVPQAR